MSTETLEYLKAIRDGKPKDATHIQKYNCGDVYFMYRDNNFWFYDNVYKCYEPVFNFDIDSIRSLKDVEDKIELMERIESLEDEIKYGDDRDI